LFEKIQKGGQSAGRKILYKLLKKYMLNSSETKRETLSNFSYDFRFWLLGFTEGKGHFIIDKKGFLVFKLIQDRNNANILFYIKKELGFGIIRNHRTLPNKVCFVIKKKYDIYQLIKIFNGNFYLYIVRRKFSVWLEAFNKIYNTHIKFIDNDNVPNLLTFWFTGLTDAIGFFGVSVYLLGDRSEGHNVQVRYVMRLPKGEPDHIKQKLARLVFGFYVAHLKGDDLVVNYSSLSKLISYFNAYSLKTNKFFTFAKWLFVYNSRKDKLHLTEQGLDVILELAKEINKNYLLTTKEEFFYNDFNSTF
jgi:LAGLIDADG endonuclease